MLRKINLKNFKRFREISLELKPITLISGENNTGKSSILESVFLFYDCIAPDVFIKLIDFRGTRVARTSESLWAPFFSDLNIDEPLSIEGQSDLVENNGINAVSFKKATAFSMSDIPNDFKQSAYSNSTQYVLNHTVEIGETVYSGYQIIKDGQIIFYMEDHPKLNDYVHYIGPHVHPTAEMVADLFSKVELTGKKNTLIQALQLLDRSINNIMTLMIEGIVKLYVSFADGAKFPIDLMGDGIQKLLYVTLIMLSKPNCTLLLDEVENGLHYSLHTKFWETLSNIATQNNCQIIATTHSYECINGALTGIKKNGLEDKFLYTRLSENNGIVQPKSFISETLGFALSSEMEVR